MSYVVLCGCVDVGGWIGGRGGGGNEYLRIHRPRDFRRLFRLLRIYLRLSVGCTRFVHRYVSSHLKKGKVVVIIIISGFLISYIFMI